MRAIFGLVLLVGMALAGAAVYMIQGYIAQTEAALQKEREFNGKVGKLVEVYVFSKPLAYGTPLTEEDVQLIYWPESALPETVFREKEVLFPENARGPRYVLRATEAFEPVLASRVTEPGELANLAAKLDGNKRAFAIRVGVTSGVSAFVKPDDLIDIYWTGGAPGYEGDITRLIESSVQIIAVDNSFNADQSAENTAAASVTVAVTPEQVARLTQAQSTGRLSLSLVGTGAEAVTGLVEVDTKGMLGIEDVEALPTPVPTPVPTPMPVERKCYAKQRKGGELVNTDIEIPCAD